MTHQNKNTLPLRYDGGEPLESRAEATITDINKYRRRKLANVTLLRTKNGPENAPQLPHSAEIKDFPKHPHTPQGPEAA